MFICNMFLTFIIKLLINGTHKIFLKHSIINGFRTHHLSTFAKRFLSNVCKTKKHLLGSSNLYQSKNLMGLEQVAYSIYTDSDIESIVGNLVSHDSIDSDTSPVVKHKYDFKTSRKGSHGKGKVMSDPRSEVKPDQDLINQRILSLLKAIGK